MHQLGARCLQLRGCESLDLADEVVEITVGQPVGKDLGVGAGDLARARDQRRLHQLLRTSLRKPLGNDDNTHPAGRMLCNYAKSF